MTLSLFLYIIEFDKKHHKKLIPNACQYNNIQPKITLIVVGKHHHIQYGVFLIIWIPYRFILFVSHASWALKNQQNVMMVTVILAK